MIQRNKHNFEKWYRNFPLPEDELLASAYPKWKIGTTLNGKQRLIRSSEMIRFARLLDLHQDLIELGWEKIILVGKSSIKIITNDAYLKGSIVNALEFNPGVHVIHTSGSRSVRVVVIPQLTTMEIVLQQLLGRFYLEEDEKWMSEGFSLYKLKSRIKELKKIVEEQIGGSITAFDLISYHLARD
jgi:hypothetical protein